MNISTTSIIRHRAWTSSKMPVSGLYCLDNDNRFAGAEQPKGCNVGFEDRETREI